MENKKRAWPVLSGVHMPQGRGGRREVEPPQTQRQVVKWTDLRDNEKRRVRIKASGVTHHLGDVPKDLPRRYLIHVKSMPRLATEAGPGALPRQARSGLRLMPAAGAAAEGSRRTPVLGTALQEGLGDSTHARLAQCRLSTGDSSEGLARLHSPHSGASWRKSMKKSIFSFHLVGSPSVLGPGLSCLQVDVKSWHFRVEILVWRV